MEDTSSGDPPSADAIERLLGPILELADAEQAAAVEALCAAHPQHAAGLRVRFGAFRCLVAAGPLVARVQALDGLSDAARLRLDRLSARQAHAAERYVVQGEVARGGMGVVFRVLDRDLDRPLAMKVILAGAAPATEDSPASTPALERFLGEAQITGQLDHPGVVPVHELGVDGAGRVYFTMRLIHGETASEVFARIHADVAGWTRTRGIEIVLKVCDTVAFAHERGIVHRDLKPANVMIGRFGEVYVMDWGLSKVLGQPDPRDLRLRPHGDASAASAAPGFGAAAGSPLVTMDGAVLGTPCFMSPEQAHGRIEDVGPRSDQYALGAMLYALLTGQPPYLGPAREASPYAVLAQVQAGPPRAIRSLAPSVPPELAAICEKAMARRREDRYPDVRSMADDLRAYLDHRVVQAHRTGAWAETVQWVRRNRGFAASLALAFMVTLGALLWISLVLDREQGARSEADLSARAARSERDAAERREYSAAMAAAESALRAADVVDARTHLEAAPGRLRNWEWHYLWRRLDGGRRLGQHEAGIECVVQSPDGQRVLTASRDGTARVWDVDKGEEIMRLQHASEVRSALWHPRGAQLLTGTNDGLVLWDAATGARLGQLPLPSHSLSLALGHDGSTLAVGGADGVVRLCRLEDLGAPSKGPGILPQIRELRGHRDRVNELQWCADGRLLSASSDFSILIWDCGAGRPLATLKEHKGPVWGLALHPDGTRLASSSTDRLILIWDLERQRVSRVLHGHTERVAAVRWNRDGSVLASVALDRTVRLWDPIGIPLQTFLGHTDNVRSVCFAGGRVVSGGSGNDCSVRSWDLVSPCDRLKCDRGNQTARVAVDPQRRWLVYASHRNPRGGLVVLADPMRGVEECLLLEDVLDEPCEPAVSENGSQLAVAASGRVFLFDGQALASAAAGSGTVPRPVESIAPPGRASAVCFGPAAGEITAGCADGSVWVWGSARTSPRLALRTDGPIRCVCATARGNLVAAISASEAVIWDAGSGTTIRQWSGLQRAQAAGFSPDGQCFALGHGQDCREITLWDCAQRRDRTVLRGHAQVVNDLAFSPDGQRLASASDDRTVRLWDPATGMAAATLREHRYLVKSVCWSGDGAALVSGGTDMLIWIRSVAGR